MIRWQVAFLGEDTALDLTDRGYAVWSLETGRVIRSSDQPPRLGIVTEMVVRIVEKNRERLALLHRDGFFVFYPPSPNGETTKRTIRLGDLSLTPQEKRERKRRVMTGLRLRLGLRSHDLSLRHPEWWYLTDLFLVPEEEPVALALYREPSLAPSAGDRFLAIGGSAESPVLLAPTSQGREILRPENLEIRIYDRVTMAAFVEDGQGERSVFFSAAPLWDVRRIATAREDAEDLIIHATPMPPVGVGVVRGSSKGLTLHVYNLNGEQIAAAALEGPELPSSVSAYDLNCRVSLGGRYVVIWHSMSSGISVFRNPLL